MGLILCNYSLPTIYLHTARKDLNQTSTLQTSSMSIFSNCEHETPTTTADVGEQNVSVSHSDGHFHGNTSLGLLCHHSWSGHPALAAFGFQSCRGQAANLALGGKKKDPLSLLSKEEREKGPRFARPGTRLTPKNNEHRAAPPTLNC